MRTLHVSAILALLAFAAWGLGCADTPDKPGWEYGDAYHTVFQNQIANPAPPSQEPVEGMNGQKAGVIYDRYQTDQVGAQEKKAGLRMETTVSQ